MILPLPFTKQNAIHIFEWINKWIVSEWRFNHLFSFSISNYWGQMWALGTRKLKISLCPQEAHKWLLTSVVFSKSRVCFFFLLSLAMCVCICVSMCVEPRDEISKILINNIFHSISYAKTTGDFHCNRGLWGRFRLCVYWIPHDVCYESESRVF